jgi:hypothetical protein
VFCQKKRTSVVLVDAVRLQTPNPFSLPARETFFSWDDTSRNDPVRKSKAAVFHYAY